MCEDNPTKHRQHSNLKQPLYIYTPWIILPGYSVTSSQAIYCRALSKKFDQCRVQFNYVRLPNPIQINRTIGVRLSFIKQLFHFRTFNCVRLVKSFGVVDYVLLSNSIEINRTIGARLSSLTERSTDYAS